MAGQASKTERDAALQRWGLSPEHIAHLDSLGHLPGYADGGEVGKDGGGNSAPITTLGMDPAAGLDPEAAMAPPPGAIPETPPPSTKGMDFGNNTTFEQDLASPAFTGGASGEWTPEGGAPGAALPVMYQPPPQPQQGPLPGLGRPGLGGIDPGAPPKLTAPDMSGEETAQKGLAGNQAWGANEQAQANEAGAERLRKEDAAWKATQTTFNGLLDDARQHASISPVAEWSTGHKVLASLAMALGSFGSALTKTPNYAMEIVNKSIDEEARGRQTALAALERKYGSAQDAHNAMRAGLLQNLQLDLQARADRSNSDIYKQKANVLTAQLAQKQQEAQNQIASSQYSMNLQRATVQVEDEKTNQSRQNLQWQMSQKYGEQYVPGLGVMRSPEVATAAGGMMRDKQLADQAIGQLMTLRRKYPGGTPPTGPDAESASQAASVLLSLGKGALGFTRLTDTDLSILSDFTGGNFLSMGKRYDTVMQNLRNQQNVWNTRAAAFRSQALIPEAEGGGLAVSSGPSSAGKLPSFRVAGQ